MQDIHGDVKQGRKLTKAPQATQNASQKSSERWGGSRTPLCMRHEFLVLTVKKMWKSVQIYGSYRKI